MRAIVYHAYGPPDVLRCEELETPLAAENEVLIEVRAASVNPLDWHLMRGTPYLLRMMAGLRKPKDVRLGADVAGRVEAVGRNVTQFKPGDEVFGSCRGAFAEYACAAESAVVAKPDNVTFEQAAAVPVAAFTALQGLRSQGQFRSGQKILINGAAGGVGTFAVQLAKGFGADVTGVCSTRNLNLVHSIGADRAIDYTQEDFTQGAQRYHSFSARRRVLSPRGICVMVGGPNGGPWLGPLAGLLEARALSPFVSQSFVLLFAKRSQEDLTLLRDLMAAGNLTPVIDSRYTLSDVADAIRHLEAGHARGKVIITMSRA
jgi:NADPH:quinone reductase-like Zn-dependent oxidoreductase